MSEEVKNDDRRIDRIIWGAENIGKVINLDQRQVYHMLAGGRLKSVVKIGGKHAARESRLLAEFDGEVAHGHDDT